MKKIAGVAVVLAVVALLAGSAMAKTAMENPDMAGSKEKVFMTCEGKGLRWIGISYDDKKRGDAMDAVSVLCKGPQGEFEVPNPDFSGRERVRLKCYKSERIWGIAYKDREGKDEADGVTLICRDRKTGEERLVYNKDLQGGREYVRITGKNAIGIAYNDRIKGDAVDGVTLVVK